MECNKTGWQELLMGSFIVIKRSGVDHSDKYWLGDKLNIRVNRAQN